MRESQMPNLVCAVIEGFNGVLELGVISYGEKYVPRCDCFLLLN